MKYFKGINDLAVLRKLYYQLALQHHPDKGGDQETMKAINNEYELASKNIINGCADFSDARKVYETEVSEELQVKINEILHFNNLIIEVIGGWIWVTGNTFPIKSELKDLAFKFSRNKTAWYWHATNYHKRSKKQFTMSGIREMWGTQEVENDKQNNLSHILN